MNYLIPEWEKQEFVQLVFPHQNTDWACCLEDAIDTFSEIAYAIAQYEKVLICYEEKNTISHLKHKNFIFKQIRNNDTWCRDFGAISIKENNKIKLLDFKFNGWGLKFPSNLDNQISREIFNIHKSYNFVLEGGSIDTNGKTLLTTSKCLLEPNRNYPMKKEEIENFLKKELHVNEIIWLNHGFLEGDDTDSHIDTLARFVNEDTIVYCTCNENDTHYNELKQMEEELKKTGFNLIPLPIPSPKIWDSHRLPATYANFLIINDAVLLPVYEDDNDKYVYDLFCEIFKDREIIPINANTLIKQHGSIHCVTKEYYSLLSILS